MYPNASHRHEDGNVLATAVRNPAVINPQERYGRNLFCIGIFEIILGVATYSAVVAEIVFLRRETWYWRDEPTYSEIVFFLGGTAVLVCGIVGMILRSKPSRCLYLTNLALSFSNIVSMSLLIILSCWTASDFQGRVEESVYACFVVLAILNFLAFFMSIAHASCSGAALSCCGEEHAGPVMYSPTLVPEQPLVPAQIPTGQIMFHQPPSSHHGPPYAYNANTPTPFIPSLSQSIAGHRPEYNHVMPSHTLASQQSASHVDPQSETPPPYMESKTQPSPHVSQLQ